MKGPLARVSHSLAALAALALGAPPAAAQCDGVKLLASDGASFDCFAEGVALSGEFALVGAENDDDDGSSSGSAYVFELVGGAWTQTAKLHASDADTGDTFGTAVALDGPTAVIGAEGDEPSGAASGSVYVFERGAVGSWKELAKLIPDDGAAGDRFGFSVAVHDRVVLVGAHRDDHAGTDSGSAYVFEYGGAAGWSQVAKLVPTDAAAGDEFGESVDVEGGRAVVGALRHDTSGRTDAGAAYTYRRTATQWVPTGAIEADDGAAGDLFGRSVSMSGATIVVGADGNDELGAEAGAAYVFELSADGWHQTAKLVASGGGAGDRFGWSVSIDGDLVVVGAEQASGAAAGSGAAYVFQRQDGAWVEVAKLEPGDGQSGDDLGHTVAIAGQRALVGAPEDDDQGSGSGSAHVFDLVPGGALFACPAMLSVSAGGQQDFTLDAGPSNALELYFLLGSASGTSPGIGLDRLTLPLNPDGYLALTLGSPNSPPLNSSLGVLDGAGKGAASFALPPGGDASLVGVQLHHAYLVLDLFGSGAPLFASDAVALTLGP